MRIHRRTCGNCGRKFLLASILTELATGGSLCSRKCQDEKWREYLRVIGGLLGQIEDQI